MHFHNVIFNVIALLYLITQRAILRVPLEYNNSVSLCVEFNRGLIMKYSMQCVCFNGVGYLLDDGFSRNSLFISSTVPGEGGGGKSCCSSLLP